MIEEQEQPYDKELVVRSNEEIKKQHALKLANIAAQEYKFKNISQTHPLLEGLLLLYQRENILTKDSDLQFASAEIKQFPIIKEYAVKELPLNTFCFHFLEEMKYSLIPLGEELFQKQLQEEQICLILKGKAAVVKERTPQQIQQDLIKTLKIHINEINKEIRDKKLQQKLKVYIQEQSEKIQRSDSKSSSQLKISSNIDVIPEENQNQALPLKSQVQITNIKARRQSKRMSSKILVKKNSIKIDEVCYDSFNNHFTKDEVKILSPIIRERFTRAIYQLIDSPESEITQENIYQQQNQLLLWFQTKTDLFFNDYGVPKYEEVKSFFSGDHFTNKIIEEERSKKKIFIFAADDLHMISISRSQYQSISNYSEDQVKEKLKLFSEKLKDISKSTMLKFIYYFKKKEFKRKHHLWHEKDKVDGLYFILNGEIEYTKSHRVRIKTAKKQSLHEIELVNKNDKITKQLTVCTFQQGNFIGEEDFFEARRGFSAAAKSEIVTVYYLQLKDFENIKKYITDICNLLTNKSESKKKLLDQKLKNAIQNCEQQNKSQNSLTQLLEENEKFLNGSNQLRRKSSIQMVSFHNTPINQEVFQFQRMIEMKEKQKFTNTNNIKEINKLFRKEFGKKKYLQMIKNNPQVILSDSTLNSLESVMSLPEENKQDTKQNEDRKRTLNNQMYQSSQNKVKAKNKQQNISQDSSISVEEVEGIQLLKNQSQKEKKNSLMKRSIQNIMSMNSVFKQIKGKQNIDINANLQLGQEKQFSLNSFDFMSSEKQFHNSQPILKQAQSIISPLLQQSQNQQQISKVLTPTDISPTKMKVRGKMFTKKEKQIQKQQMLQDELNSEKFQNLKKFLSDQQIQHLAHKKLKRQEDLKDINKLSMFEQQQIKHSFMKKAIRPGQKEMLTQEQKIQIKSMLQSQIYGKGDKVDSDFIFKSVQTAQSIKQLNFKIHQKLRNKPGFQNKIDVSIKDKPWKDTPNLMSTSLQLNSQIQFLDISRNRHSISSVLSNPLMTQSNPLNHSVTQNLATPFSSSPKNSHRLSVFNSPKILQDLPSTPKSQDQVISGGSSQVVDNVIESQQANQLQKNENNFDLENSIKMSSDEKRNSLDQRDVSQQIASSTFTQKRSQSASTKSEFFRAQSPILVSRNHNPKFQVQGKPQMIQANQQLFNEPIESIQISSEKTRIASLVQQIQDLRQNVESIRMINQNISSQFKSSPKMSSTSAYFDNGRKLSKDQTINISNKERYSIMHSTPKSAHNKRPSQNSFKANTNTNTISNAEYYTDAKDTKSIKSMQNNSQHVFSPYIGSIPLDYLTMDQIESNPIQPRPQSSIISSHQRRALSGYSNVFTQYCQIVQDNAPLTIKSLKLEDFQSFDTIRINNSSRIQSASPDGRNQMSQQNQSIFNNYLQSNLNQVPSLNLLTPQSRPSVNQSHRNSFLAPRKFSEAYIQQPALQQNYYQQQYLGTSPKIINYTPNVDEGQKKDEYVVNNGFKPQKQKILPFQQIHSAKGRKQCLEEDVINQIGKEFKKCKGLIVVPTSLLRNTQSNPNQVK